MGRYGGMRFIGRPIDRAAALGLRKDPAALKQVLESPNSRFVVVHTPAGSPPVARILSSAKEPPAVEWWTRERVLSVAPAADEQAIYLGPVLEGACIDICHGFAINLAPLSKDIVDMQPQELEPPPGSVWLTGREFMTSAASDADVTIAGLALGMVNWHETALYDGRSGQASVPVEGGMKRQEKNGRGKSYPRIDPVAIGLIESADGKRLLLGRSAKYRQGFYTCLSGFVEQCESVEEAFKREAFEEAGVELNSVELVASQPWPIGRAGSCELMIACRATASSDALHVNPSELEDARWFSREEVMDMLTGTHPQRLNVPGRYAIAHHLINNWAHEEFAGMVKSNASVLSDSTMPALAMVLGLTIGLALAKLSARL